MKTALFYLLQVVTGSGILYGYYHLFLRNKKFHQYNRYFLLISVTISIVIPFLQIPVYFENEASQPLLVKTLTVFSSEDFGDEAVINSVVQTPSLFTWKNILSIFYVLTGLLLFARFWISLFRVIRLMRIYPGEKIDNIRFIPTNEPDTPFSFFRWLFWNNKIELNSDYGQQILRHELFHIRQKHSWDTIFLEIIAIFLWINPFFHLIKKEIKAIHEFLADKHAVEDNKEWDYAELLLMQALGTANTRLINPFFHNQIKRRIAMLTTSNKTGYQYLRKIMVLPLAAIIIGLFAFTYKDKLKNPMAWQGEPLTIVIDAGHGGNDPGAISPIDEYTEAAINLEIAQTIKDLGKAYNINVILTREDKNFPGNASTKDEALRKRVEIAEEVNPIAFISLHLNRTANLKQQKSHSGFEVLISKKKDAGSLNLATAILKNLSAVYKTRDEAKTQDAGIYLLDKASSSAILLQCGYIDNLSDLEFITQKNNQEKVARSILEGIINFKLYAPQETALAPPVDTIPEKITKKTAYISHPEKIILQADTIFFHPDTKKEKPDFSKSVVVINDARYEPGVLQTKTIISKEVHFYSKGDEDAVRLFGNAASNGALVFKDAKIIDQAPADYYKNEFSTQKNDTDKVFSKVEIEPAFMGGSNAWEKFLERNMDNTIPARKGAPNGHYTVFIQFIVDEEGNVSDVVPLTKHGYGMEAEAVRLIKKGPKWMPGIQNGKKVKAYKKQPFNFKIPAGVQSIAIDQIKPNREVVVVGYSTKKAKSAKKEIVVQGKPIPKKITLADKNGKPLKEKVVVGHPLKKIVFQQTETEPSFPGGNAAWVKYLERNANPNIPIDNGAPGGTYNVRVIFIVNTDGSVTDIKPLTDFGYGMEEEAARLIKSSPHWVPAEQNGKKVNAYRKQPITFQVVEENEITEADKLPEISLDQLKNLNSHALLGVAKDVQLISYTLEIEGPNGTILSSANFGDRHTTNTIDLINSLSPGKIVLIESIIGTISGQQIKYPSRIYKLI